MRNQNIIKLLTVFAVVAIVQCGRNNKSNNLQQPQDIQAGELIGNWTTTHVSMARCIANGDTLAPDTLKVQSNYWIAQDSIITQVNQIIRSPCGIIPLPLAILDVATWKTRHDSLFVYPVRDSSGKLKDTACYKLTKLTSGKMIFSSKKSVDTCTDDGAKPPVIETGIQ